MDFEEAKQRVTALREQIEYHSRRYYDLDDPEIEDSEFDALTRELRTLETDYPQLVTADSYTQRVHGEVSALFTPVAHEVPLASLQDVFDIEELREFDARVRGDGRGSAVCGGAENRRPVRRPRVCGRRV